MAPSSSWMTVERSEPELVTPSEPTPYELKYLSDIDDEKFHQVQIPVVQVYRRIEGMKVDPAKAIKQALAKALVYYYPFAGRLREGSNGKLIVECTGEGVLFIEANADVTLDHFIDSLVPPIPAIDELLYDVPGSSGILNCPLLLIQITRLACGGFVVAHRFNHTMCDGAGLGQFMNAVAEIARGASIPSVEPLWNRDLLMARDPPRVTCVHNGYEETPSPAVNIPPMRGDDMVHGSCFFGPEETSTLRNHLPVHLRSCSTFDVVTACLWRCRTIALGPDNPNQEVRLLSAIDVRKKLIPPLPLGYYGNAFATFTAVAKAGELCENPLTYALELVQNAKAGITDEYVRSLADFLVLKGRPMKKIQWTYGVSDVRHVGWGEVDFGWGKPIYGGIAKVDINGLFGMLSFYVSTRNSKGENGLVATISLPKTATEKFVMELDKLIKHPFTPQRASRTMPEPGYWVRGGNAYNSRRNYSTVGNIFRFVCKKF